MININLLPHHLRPIKRTPLPYMASFLVVVLVVCAMGWLFVMTQAKIMIKQGRLNEVNAQLTQLKPVIDEYAQLQKDKQMLARKIATINEIVNGRIIWSRELFNLARLAPSNLWFSGMKVETKIAKEVRTGKDPKTGEPKTETVTVTHPVMTVSGYVVATPSLAANVSGFAQAAEQDAEFSSLFLQENMSVEDTEFEKTPVKKFNLDFRIVPGGAAK
ncbi:MAG: hypothetical protein RBU21_14285 [FCB group bacterium]|jgi:hypothetical protein|nr:hypothetical protein [FCB group bacterium]